MFESGGIDIERVFGDDRAMSRTHVRWRRVLLTAAAVAILGVVVLGGPLTDASGHTPTEAVRHSRYVVASGDTIWSIARRAAPGTDPRPLVEAIEQVNHVQPGDLVPGQTLEIPSTLAPA
jgi:nucleoid-associated protein YgaU